MNANTMLSFSSKTEARRWFAQRRRDCLAQPTFDKSGTDRLICDQVEALLKGVQAKTCASFRALPNEPDLWPLRERLPKVKFYFPRVHGEDLVFLPGTELSDFEVSKFQILEPKMKSNMAVSVQSLDVALVPAIAVDGKGQRLGSGRGFYDRALNSSQTASEQKMKSVLKVGVIYHEQYSKMDLPMDPMDVPMDCVATESFVMQVQRWTSERVN